MSSSHEDNFCAETFSSENIFFLSAVIKATRNQLHFHIRRTKRRSKLNNLDWYAFPFVHHLQLYTSERVFVRIWFNLQTSCLLQMNDNRIAIDCTFEAESYVSCLSCFHYAKIAVSSDVGFVGFCLIHELHGRKPKQKNTFVGRRTMMLPLQTTTHLLWVGLRRSNAIPDVSMFHITAYFCCFFRHPFPFDHILLPLFSNTKSRCRAGIYPSGLVFVSEQTSLPTLKSIHSMECHVGIQRHVTQHRGFSFWFIVSLCQRIQINSSCEKIIFCCYILPVLFQSFSLYPFPRRLAKEVFGFVLFLSQILRNLRCVLKKLVFLTMSSCCWCLCAVLSFCAFNTPESLWWEEVSGERKREISSTVCNLSPSHGKWC